jgi:starch synthase
VKPIVLHVAAEVSPFHKSGGLGDVLSGLPPALARRGLDVRIVTGFYGETTRLASIGGPAALEAWPVTLDFQLGPNRISARILEARTHGGAVTTYFVDAPHLSRGGLYGHGDDVYRFCVMSRAATAIAGVLHRSQQMGRLAAIHAHDWHAAAALYHARASDELRHVPSLLTIHNLAFQGDAAASSAPYLGISWEAYHALFEHHGALNLMKGGILVADRVTTVSPNYAREIQTPHFGLGLDGLLRHVSGKLLGIANGIDTRSWDPDRDRSLPVPFSADHPDGKESCRAALRWELALEARDEAPLLGLVSRLTHQKGIDLLCDVASRFVEDGGQIAVLGEGEEQLEHRLYWLQHTYPGNVAYRRAFDDGLARRIYAGSDLFAMPSRFEPCGLAQLYAMRYGSLPVAHATGGLVDTVARLHDQHSVGGATGILYDHNDAWGFGGALRWGREIFADRDALEVMRDNAMRSSHSWDDAAAGYIDMYRDLGVPV